MKIIQLREKDIIVAAQLAVKVWTDSSADELEQEFEEQLHSERIVNFICILDEEKSIGFMQVSVRNEYVEGATTLPIGYLEGIYVETEFRRKGIAEKMVKVGEEWSKGKGCSEFASDVEIHNMDSQKFHEKLGFKEVNRIVSYHKKLS